MKHALIFGGGSNNSQTIVETLIDNEYKVLNIGSSVFDNKMVENIKVDWKDLDLKFINKLQIDHLLDFVFFSQNSSSLKHSDFNIRNCDTLSNWRKIKDWQQSLWLSCQMPFIALHHLEKNLHENSCVGWMLSSYVNYKKENVHNHPDYSSYKFFNYLSMKCFAEQNNFNTFGIMPNFGHDNSKNKLKNIIDQVITSNNLKAKVYKC